MSVTSEDAGPTLGPGHVQLSTTNFYATAELGDSSAGNVSAADDLEDDVSRGRALTITLSAIKEHQSLHLKQPSKSDHATLNFAPHVIDNAPTVLAWSNLTVRSKKNPERALLNHVSGKIAGGLWAVMGPSGSGKSTLLNTLACRLTRGMYSEGEFRLNGQLYSQHELKAMSGYVMQDDLLNGSLTVEETLQYTAELRLPRDTTREHRKARVEEALLDMGLLHCRHTIIGDALQKGISGGERKRVCVAMELITHPQLLFLDEPTSGLDSVTAFSLCDKLKVLAESGRCTVICTIHQPASRTFALFHNVILLKSGDIIFQGKIERALDLYAVAGFPCPPQTNPADHLLDIITPALGEDSKITQAKGEQLKQFFKLPEVDLTFGGDKPLRHLREVIPWTKQYSILLRRSFRESFRSWELIATQVLNSILGAILIGFAFYDIGNHQVSINKRQSVLFFCVINQGTFAALQTINSFPRERALILRERAAGTYHVSAYFLAKMTVETVFQIPPPIIFSVIVYYLVGFQRDPLKEFTFLCFMILCSLSATSLALMVSTICRTTDLSVIVLPFFLEIGRLFGGFFLPPIQLPHYFVWLDAISYVKYTYTGIALSELDGLTYTCTPTELNPLSGVCPVTTGQQTVEKLGLDYMTIGGTAAVLVSYIIICRFISYLGLRYIKW